MSKQQLREIYRRQRREMPVAEREARSTRLCATFLRWFMPVAADYRSILAFYPTAGEPDIVPLLNELYRCGQNLYLPVIAASNQEMAFHGWDPQARLVDNKYRIPEPEPSQPRLSEDLLNEHALILVPALAADMRGHRLGHGAGYYDRFLAAYPGLSAMVVVFNSCLVVELPAELHDRPVDWLLSEDKVFQTERSC